MKYEQDVKKLLVHNTMMLIADGGFEKATTRAITHYSGSLPDMNMNEVYIYRLFGSKEHLYEVAFEQLDGEFLHALLGIFGNLTADIDNVERSLYQSFLRIWSFVLQNESRCRCYVRYYYSIYFKGESLKCHNEKFDHIITIFAPLFKQEADVRSIMHSILTTLLDFAIRVYNGDLEPDPVNTYHVFNVLYCTMLAYFRDDITRERFTPPLRQQAETCE